jgi:hypothetical protein
LDLGGDARLAIIAAKKIVFKEGAVLRHGQTSLLLIANSFKFSEGSRIEAWGETAARSSDATRAVAGLAAGDVRIIVLNSVQGVLRIDSYGQRGSEGAPGPDGTPWTGNDRPEQKKTYGPAWSIRPYTMDELLDAKQTIGRLLSEHPKGERLIPSSQLVDSCMRRSGLCVAALCDEVRNRPDRKSDHANTDLWDSRSKGTKGYEGRPGGNGADGGASGVPGRVLITLAQDDGSQHFVWGDGTDIQKQGSDLPGAPGGQPGAPGEGGRGGKGVDADPVNACRPGAEGEKGEDFKPSRERAGPTYGHEGSQRKAPEPALIQIHGISTS